jgi:hypothetical protein
MPLLFGALGTTLGVAPLFWVAGGAVGVGSRLTSGLNPHGGPEAGAGRGHGR